MEWPILAQLWGDGWPARRRIFAIATSPLNGDVWLATNAGLSRYSLDKDTWTYYTRSTGLPSDQIQTLAFAADGTLYVGSQCDGLDIASATDDYHAWKVISGPASMPTCAVGQGLPSAQINDILVTPDTVYVATTCGLARSSDGGASWSFVRGQDWEDKVKNLRSHPQPAPLPADFHGELLREDYVRSLGMDYDGHLVVGFWSQGYEIRRPSNDQVLLRSAPKSGNGSQFVQAILPARDGSTLLANYGEGLTQAEETPPFQITPAEQTQLTAWREANAQRLEAMRAPFTALQAKGNTGIAPNTANTITAPSVIVTGAPAGFETNFPKVAPPPTLQELKRLSAQVWANQKKLAPGEGYYEGDDWRTQGDWVGRYGTRHALLCASGAPLDHHFINDPSYAISGFMGPDFPNNDLRHWIQWLTTDNPHVLYNPLVGNRREAEWDDNGETMSMKLDGPDVWTKVVVPEGTHRLSIYDFNKDGHQDTNRMRDFLIELKKGDAQNVAGAESLPTQATARLHEFWAGGYKRFVVQGPGTFWLKVGRNNSWNTILCGIFLDKLNGPATPFDNGSSSLLGQVRYEQGVQAPEPLNAAHDTSLPAQSIEVAKREAATLTAAQSVWDALDENACMPAYADMQWEGRLLAYRAVGCLGWGDRIVTGNDRMVGYGPQRAALLKNWRWQMALWTRQDRSEFTQVMATAHQSLLKKNPDLIRIKF